MLGLEVGHDFKHVKLWVLVEVGLQPALKTVEGLQGMLLFLVLHREVLIREV